MEGYNKTILRNHKGEVLLPRTTSSMVSEESDRRFVDNVEKTLLNTLAINSEALSELIKNAQSLGSLSAVEIQLLNLLDTVPNDLQEWRATLEDLSVLRDKVPELLDSLVAPPRLVSETSKKTYILQVDDTDLGKPKIVLALENAVSQQPEGYKIGDQWLVGQSAPDVKISIPLNKIAVIKRGSLVNFAAGEEAQGLTGDDINKVFSDLGYRISSSETYALTTNYEYYQPEIDKYSASGYTGQGLVNEDISDLRNGDIVTLSVKNKSKDVCSLIIAQVNSAHKDSQGRNFVNTTSKGLLESDNKVDVAILPQAYISFDVVNTLQTHFQKDLSQTIKKFTLNVGVKPNNATSVKTQAFSQGELIQPVRTNTDKNSFTKASFSGLTWQMSIDRDFINNFLNGEGKIALLSYVDGDAATKDFYINKPTLDIFIENPYKGKSITAVADQVGEFDILDWQLA